MNESQFQKAAGIGAEAAARWYPHIDAALAEFGITTTEDIAMFIAQVSHESAGFSRLVESLNYTPTALVSTFGKARISQYQADMLGRTVDHPANQPAIANLVYGGEWGKTYLGNQGSGDGWKYRGRGLIQITGLANYRSCGAALKTDLVSAPELLAQDDGAARSAAWFFSSRGCLQHTGDLAAVTRIINGGLTGIEQRRSLYGRALDALK